MGHVGNYNKNIHDLYIYDKEPVLDWANNRYEWAEPIGYNPNLYLNFIDTYVPGSTFPKNLDFSGVLLRKRGAAFYLGGEGYAPEQWNYPGKPMGYPYFDGFGTTSGSFAGNPQSSPNNIPLRRALLEDGWCGAYPNIGNDYNYWNPGDIPGCLISPAHVLVGAHMFLPLIEGRTLRGFGPQGITAFRPDEVGTTFDPYFKVKFLGKNNVVYEKTAYLSFMFSSAIEYGECSNGGLDGIYNDNFCMDYATNLGSSTIFQNGKDLAILELRDPNNLNTCLPLSTEELKYVKPYKIANIRSWPASTPLFLVNPQGILLVFRYNGSDSPDTGIPFFPLSNSNIPFPAYEQLDGLGGKSTTYQGGPYIGDSLNFGYGYYPPTGETVFFATLQGSVGFYHNRAYGDEITDAPILKSLKTWINQRMIDVTGTGYNIEWLDYSSATSAITIGNETYPLVAQVSAGTTQSFYSGFTIPRYPYGFTSGLTYGFVVSAFNVGGFSGFAGPVNAII